MADPVRAEETLDRAVGPVQGFYVRSEAATTERVYLAMVAANTDDKYVLAEAATRALFSETESE